MRIAVSKPGKRTVRDHATKARIFSASLAAALLTGAELAAAADDFEVKAGALLQVVATDNLRRAPTNTQNEQIIIPEAHILVRAAEPYLDLFMTGGIVYDLYLNESSLNRLTGNALANAELEVVPEFFFIDASAQMSDEFLDRTQASPIAVPNGAAQSRVFNYQISPYVTTDLFSEADLTLRARVAELSFEPLDDTLPSLVPTDSTIYQAAAFLSNGARSKRVLWRLSGDYGIERRKGFEDLVQANGLFSATVRVTPKIGLIGRVGYESIEQPILADIKDTVWSAGFVFNFSESSSFSVEHGHRLGTTDWDAHLNLALNSNLTITGSYSQHLETEQSRLSRLLGDLFTQSGNPPPPAGPAPIAPTDDLIDDTFLSKDAIVTASYVTPERTFTLSGRHTSRDLSAAGDEEETAGIAAAFSERIAPHLRWDLTGDYSTTLDARPGDVTDHSYIATTGLAYLLNDNLSASLRYVWNRTEAVTVVEENVVTLSIAQEF